MTAAADPTAGIWLVSRRFDLLAFAAPALVALALVPLGRWVAPQGETPLPMWVILVLLVDVAHVWSTAYRTYFDGDEFRRRRALYVGVPVVAYAIGAGLAFWSWALFWTVLAYLAVFHFVRQQYGWVALYNRRDSGVGPWERRIDTASIYAATLFPLLWWHAHLPRRFHWFLPGDFIDGAVLSGFVEPLGAVYAGCLAAFFVVQLHRARTDGPRWGKIVVVSTTAACWGIGIIATNTDWAFTVTNVLIHGVPYMAVVWAIGRKDAHRLAAGSWQRHMFSARWGAAAFFASLAVLAYVEEWGWDRLIWHGDQGLFWGPAFDLGTMTLAILPLLAVPQVTHYILDGFIWRGSFRTATER